MYGIIKTILFATWIHTVASWVTVNSPKCWRRTNSHLQASSDSSSWQSHVSTHPVGTSALQKVLDELPDSNTPDIAFMFVGQSHAADFGALVQKCSSYFGPDTHLISVVGGGVIGEGKELDIPTQPCLSIMTGKLPEDSSVKIQDPQTSKLDEDGDFLLFADPFADVEGIVGKLETSSSVLAGGISCPLSNDLPSVAYMNQELPVGSAITVQLLGSVGLQTVVAQGCRPVGDEVLTVTDVYKEQVITKLNGKPAMEVLQQMANEANSEDQKLIETGLLCGIASSDGDGDYLSRQIGGFVPALNGILIGTKSIKKGDRLCFQVRDAKIAKQDFKWMVDRTKAARLVDGSIRPLAALQISCVARGRSMFDEPNIDVSNTIEMLPDDHPVVGGFFANGEIGPVGISGGSSRQIKPSHVHGFTTVVAVICDKSSVKDNKTDEVMDAWG